MYTTWSWLTSATNFTSCLSDVETCRSASRLCLVITVYAVTLSCWQSFFLLTYIHAYYVEYAANDMLTTFRCNILMAFAWHVVGCVCVVIVEASLQLTWCCTEDWQMFVVNVKVTCGWFVSSLQVLVLMTRKWLQRCSMATVLSMSRWTPPHLCSFIVFQFCSKSCELQDWDSCVRVVWWSCTALHPGYHVVLLYADNTLQCCRKL